MLDEPLPQRCGEGDFPEFERSAPYEVQMTMFGLNKTVEYRL
jgi:hypothetical protein